MGRHPHTQVDPPRPGRAELGPELGDLVQIGADDRFLDRLVAHLDLDPISPAGAGAADTSADPGAGADDTGSTAELSRLFSTWRAELHPSQLPPTPSVGTADWALRRGRRRTARPVVAAAAALAVLLLGSAAVGSRAARPGDTLWPVASVLWADRVDSAEAGRSAQNYLLRARSELSGGRVVNASAALTEVSGQLPRIQARDGLAELRSTYSVLVGEVSQQMSSDLLSSNQASDTAPSPPPPPPPVPAPVRKRDVVAGSAQRPRGPASSPSPSTAGPGPAGTVAPRSGPTPTSAAAPPRPTPVVTEPVAVQAAPPVVLVPAPPAGQDPAAPGASLSPLALSAPDAFTLPGRPSPAPGGSTSNPTAGTVTSAPVPPAPVPPAPAPPAPAPPVAPPSAPPPPAPPVTTPPVKPPPVVPPPVKPPPVTPPPVKPPPVSPPPAPPVTVTPTPADPTTPPAPIEPPATGPADASAAVPPPATDVPGTAVDPGTAGNEPGPSVPADGNAASG